MADLKFNLPNDDGSMTGVVWRLLGAHLHILDNLKLKTLLVIENGYHISAFTVQVLKRILIFVSGFAMYIIANVAKICF